VGLTPREQGIEDIVGRGGPVEPRARPDGESRTGTAHDALFYRFGEEDSSAPTLEPLHIDGPPIRQ